MAVQALAEGFLILAVIRLVASGLFNHLPTHALAKAFLDLR
jgi:hypothetical protein